MNCCVVLAAWIALQSLSISGTVLDQSGATIPDAVITLKKGATVQTAQTDTAGAFTFAGISSGTYELQAQRDGFKQATARVVVGNRAPRPVQLKLNVADLQQEISVAGDDQQVNTQTDSN